MCLPDNDVIQTNLDPGPLHRMRLCKAPLHLGSKTANPVQPWFKIVNIVLGFQNSRENQSFMNISSIRWQVYAFVLGFIL